MELKHIENDPLASKKLPYYEVILRAENTWAEEISSNYYFTEEEIQLHLPALKILQDGLEADTHGAPIIQEELKQSLESIFHNFNKFRGSFYLELQDIWYHPACGHKQRVSIED